MLALGLKSEEQRLGEGRVPSQFLEQVAIQAREQERERIALEIHDGVAQTLATALRYLQALEGLSAEDWGRARPLLLRARTLTRQAISEVRSLINALQPATLRHLGLAATLSQEMRQLEADTGWQVEFVACCRRLPKETELALYRIAHEAIANARKHSGTRRLRVALVQQADSVCLEIQDWGKGFSLDNQPPGEGTGRGLTSMQRRAELLGGTFRLHSQRGVGTTIQVEVPITKEQ